ncbi:flagella biosynthesis chaperone for FliD, FliT [Shewanella atlantica]|uniref:Flagella biosynthesis chaperone for FliD, FliT n=1 Tax=Shewanella atlantica TaxID=271099 RepID=A0A3S0KJV7_9GAMM|nr:flagella biosynthesis chaperone for FliD, FliT [Shewanella atlantica]RTR32583.1 flagella biosynthesis chaperone for FliD, FliT [Shewanella atlantica]
MKELNKVNEALSSSLLQLDEINVDDDSGDELVSNLQDLLSQRQKLLELLVLDSQFVDRDYLELQLKLTQKYTVQANKVMRHRQNLLHNGKVSQRQINVYKTIGSNR